jgi:hypothetical protein
MQTAPACINIGPNKTVVSCTWFQYNTLGICTLGQVGCKLHDMYTVTKQDISCMHDVPKIFQWQLCNISVGGEGTVDIEKMCFCLCHLRLDCSGLHFYAKLLGCYPHKWLELSGCIFLRGFFLTVIQWKGVVFLSRGFVLFHFPSLTLFGYSVIFVMWCKMLMWGFWAVFTSAMPECRGSQLQANKRL